MLRLRVCEPVPHDRLHDDQALNSLTTQCSGHGPCVHGSVSAATGHARPPHVGCVMTRERVRWPTPHVRLQALQSSSVNAGYEQSTGQQCVLHARVSSLWGHAWPPKLGATVPRVRVCEPPPHDLVHVLHAPNEASTTQSTAHA